jgi:SWI/SNF-related matrix-associated actin-dependent regulator of chromatin subfamily D
VKLFGTDTIPFQKIPDLVNRYLVAPDPIILHYMINPSLPPTDRPSAYDVEVKMEDTALRSRMAVMVQSNKESSQALSKLDEEVWTYDCIQAASDLMHV